MKIAVLGGGHGCYASAAEMSEKGHEVWFWRRDSAQLAAIAEHGGIEVTDRAGTRTVQIAHLCASLEEAVAEAELIIAPLPATAQEDLAAHLAPLLKDGQVIFMPPGTLGSIILLNAVRACGNAADISIAETGTLPYLVRKHGPASITVSAYGVRLPTGILPSRNAKHAFAMLREAYPAIEPIEDVLSAALMNAGPIIHPPLIVMNAAPLEHFDTWDIHNEGTQPSVRAVTSALDQERISVREALGYAAPHFPLADHYTTDGEEWMYGNAAHEALTDSGDWREHIVLNSHRYVREDTQLGLVLLASIADWAGQPAPIASGLVAVVSAILGEDMTLAGRSLQSLDLAAMTREEMAEFLANGARVLV